VCGCVCVCRLCETHHANIQDNIQARVHTTYRIHTYDAQSKSLDVIPRAVRETLIERTPYGNTYDCCKTDTPTFEYEEKFVLIGMRSMKTHTHAQSHNGHKPEG